MKSLLQYTKINLWAAALLSLLGGMAAFAQEPIFPAAPPPMSAEEQALEAQQHEERRLDIESRQPSDFRIAYLAAPGSSFEAVISSTFAVTPITTWEEFLSLQEAEEGESQIVLLDKSALDFVDVAWTREAYRSRIILVGIDFTYDEMVEITGDQCVNRTNRNIVFEHQFWIFEYSYTVEMNGEPQLQVDDSLKQLLDESVLELCTRDTDERISERPESIFILQGFSFRPILDESWVETLVALLMNYTYDYGIPHPESQ